MALPLAACRAVLCAAAACWTSCCLGARADVATLTVAAASAPLASLPLRREPASASAGSSWLVASGALAVLALGGTVMVGRRRGWPWLQPAARARRDTAPLRTASQALTAQASIHAVRWHGEELLLGCTPQQVTVLARRALPPPEPEAP